MANNESFLNRWSRLKTEQQTDIPITDEAANQAASVVEPATPDAEEPLAPPSDEDMPSIESLDETSDFSQFFSPNVSEALRQQALRKLFRLPEFNIRDGLNDYDDDFSQIPALSAEVAQQLRTWFDDQREAFHSALNDDEENIKTKSDVEADDNAVGDADLEG